MKQVFVACGSGIATSTMVAESIKQLLLTHPELGDIEISQCSVAELNSKASSANLIISVSPVDIDANCPVLTGLPFLTHIGKEELEEEILKILAA